MEFLERLEAHADEERWLVRAPGAAPHVLRYVLDDNAAASERATQPLVGASHPRAITIRALRCEGERLVIETDDDRGPSFTHAARQLSNPDDRERWSVAQIIGVADAIAMLRQRDRRFVHRRIDLHTILVDVAGHARMRAPIIFVDAGPRPARLGAGVIKGTFGFLAPEQCKGLRATPATDVFALAGVLYTALAGHRPFAADTDFGTLQAIIGGEPAPIETRAPGLQRVLARAFAKEPSMRYPDVGTFAGELWRCVPDAMEYDAVISDRVVAWRTDQPDEQRSQTFSEPPCRMAWDGLDATDNPDVRHCASCRQDVVQVASLAQIVPLAGRCVAYTGGE